MKVCVIGNSHLGALKLARDQGIADTNGAALTFFGSHAGTLRSLKLQDNCLVSDDPDVQKWLAFTSGGQTRIDPSLFDAVLVLGCGYGLGRAASVYRSHRLPAHRTSADQELISEAALAAAVADILANTIGLRVMRLVKRAAPGKPVAFLPDPIPAKSIIRGDAPWLAAHDTLAMFHGLFKSSRKAVAKMVHVVRQPLDTIEQGFTAPQFTAGSVKMLPGFVQKHNADEPYHMNAQYGARILTQVLSTFLPSAPNQALASSQSSSTA